MRLWCHVHPQKRELTNFHIRNFRVDYTAVFDVSSNVTGNSQYCCCSSLCTVHPLQKGPVHSDLSKQLVWHVAPKKTIQLTCSLYLSRRPPRGLSPPVARDLIHILVGGECYHLCHTIWNATVAEMQTVERVQQAGRQAQRQFLYPEQGSQLSLCFWQQSQRQRGRCSELTLIFVLNN